ncbi:MAG: hypothetical protein HKN45_07225, partial [Flavobacteriales bacterium]|nr:hypothetical protein [Flavobacteriales bacterium]
MRKTILIIGVFVSTIQSGLTAQDSLATMYAETITASELETHLEVISADDYEGRESGYLGQKKCEEYMVSHYRKWGLPPVKGKYTQEFELSLDDPKKVRVASEGEQLTFIEDFYYFPSAPDGLITGDIYYSGYGIADKRYRDINTLDIEGK